MSCSTVSKLFGSPTLYAMYKRYKSGLCSQFLTLKLIKSTWIESRHEATVRNTDLRGWRWTIAQLLAPRCRPMQRSSASNHWYLKLMIEVSVMHLCFSEGKSSPQFKCRNPVIKSLLNETLWIYWPSSKMTNRFY